MDHLVFCVLDEPGLDLLDALLIIVIRVAQIGNVCLPAMGDDGSQRLGDVAAALDHPIVIDLLDPDLRGFLLFIRRAFRLIDRLRLFKDCLESLVMIRVRMRNDHGESRRLVLGGTQVEPPFQETVHIALLARIDQEMLVVRGDDMASVSLPHVDEIDLDRPLFLHLFP